jgi:hypothetical protein
MKTLLLACFGLERRPRCYGSPETRQARYARAWARRWWVVGAESAETARLVIEQTRNHSPAAHAYSQTGRIIDCGRNGRGGLRRRKR